MKITLTPPLTIAWYYFTFALLQKRKYCFLPLSLLGVAFAEQCVSLQRQTQTVEKVWQDQVLQKSFSN